MDSLTIYKNEIVKFPRLTPEQEKELAVRVQAGDEEARETLITSNLRLVPFVAQKFQGRGLDMEDLMMEGNLGLMTAAEKFDASKDVRFSTYAVMWIQQKIRRGIANTSHTIRIPVHISESISKLANVREDLTKALGHEPTHAELALALEVEEDKVNELVEASHGSLSLDNAAGEDLTFADLMQARGADAQAEVFAGLEKERVAKLLGKLPEQQAKVIKFRFGFDGAGEMTLDEIGKVLGVTRERVRQIEEKALDKLRKIA